jgi:hypothetical protein
MPLTYFTCFSNPPFKNYDFLKFDLFDVKTCFLLAPDRRLSIDMNTLDNLNRPSQHISACSSLHKRNGALTLGRKQPRII